MADVTLIVLAKAPMPGRSKTRLCPPCTPVEAAQLAAAALHDTLRAVAATPAARRVLVLDGAPDPAWLVAGFQVLPQRGDGLDERLAAAFADVGGPAVLVGMDTPQLTPDLLLRASGALDDHDAVLGHAPDGGYWLVGLRRPEPRVFHGIPMSVAETGAAQEQRLRTLGLSTAHVPALVDVDTIVDAEHVAALAPHTAFARTLQALRPAVAA